MRMQPILFPENSPTETTWADPALRMIAGWLNPDAADQLLELCLHTIDWEHPWINVYGRRIRQPRLIAWYGDPQAVYSYSGIRLNPRPWPEFLLALKNRMETTLERKGWFNAVLLNLYRNGRDSVSWHCDNESAMGADPVLASVSVGAPRDFVLRRKRNHARRLKLTLEHGSLLYMGPGVQIDWEHALPRRARIEQPRVNLTFRRIVAS